MHNFKLVLGYIFTFGILYFALKKKAKKKALTYNEALTVSTRLPFKVEDFITRIGGKDNVKSLSSTITTIKIQLNDKNKLDNNGIKTFKPKGVMWGPNNTVMIIFGDFAMELEKQIKNKLALN